MFRRISTSCAIPVPRNDRNYKSIFLFHQTDSAQEGIKSEFLTHLPLDKITAILADDLFRCIFVNVKFSILFKISLKFVPKGQIDNNVALV